MGTSSAPDRGGEVTADGGELDEDLGEPFAVELGSTVATSAGFAASALEVQGGVTHAFVALFGSDGGDGRLVELGRVYGDAEPPKLAARRFELSGALVDHDASGVRLRLFRITTTEQRAGLTWGSEVSIGWRSAGVFDVELGAQRGLLVWDEIDKSGKQHASVRAMSYNPASLAETTGPRVLSAAAEEAEVPELAARPGGFWLAWLSSSTRRSAHAESPSVVDFGQRELRLQTLDENGVATAEPRTISEGDAPVIMYDLVTAADGAAWLAWRADAASPGVEGGSVRLARVRNDGTLERRRIEDPELGVGAPTLLADSTRKDAGVWLSFSGPSGATRLGRLADDVSAPHGLTIDPVIGFADPVALAHGRLLVARPRGLAIELEALRCAG